jgi:hypothetical protein
MTRIYRFGYCRFCTLRDVISSEDCRACRDDDCRYEYDPATNDSPLDGHDIAEYERERRRERE